MSKIETNTIDNISGSSTLTIGDSNTSTITLKSGATLTNFPSNTPAFMVNLSSSQNISTGTKTVITFDTEILDSNSAYNTSNGKFTVPSGEGGKYYVYGQCMRNNFFGGRYIVYIGVNGTTKIKAEERNSDSGGTTFDTVGTGGILDLSASDEVTVSLYQDTGSTQGANGGGESLSFFMGYKLIGV